MARKKINLHVEGSGLLSERCAFDLCTIIYKFYQNHPEVYKEYLEWKAAKDAAEAASAQA